METTEDMIKRIMSEFMVNCFSKEILLKVNGKLNDLFEKDPNTISEIINESLEYIKQDLSLPNKVDIIEEIKEESEMIRKKKEK